jgi:hypothetical protein
MHAHQPFTVVERYSATAQVLRWTTVLLVVVALRERRRLRDAHLFVGQ